MGKKGKKNIVSAWRGCIRPKLSCGSSEDFRCSTWTHKCVAIFTFPRHFLTIYFTTQLFCIIAHFFWGEEYYTLKFIKADIFYFDLQIVLSNITVVFVKTLSIFFVSKCKSCEISVPGFESQTFVWPHVESNIFFSCA